jgi:soluble lytic murein transglycosylase-like protein
MRYYVFLLVAAAAWGQSSAAAQRASIAKQRASVRRQIAVIKPAVQTVIARPSCPPIAAPELSRLIGSAARENAIAPDIVLEVARQESAFQPCAVSSSGAQGVMQLMPATQAMLGVANPFDAEESIMAGARLLKDLLVRYNGDLSLALSAYNAGPRRVDEAQGIPNIAETRDYVARIVTRLTASRLTD